MWWIALLIIVIVILVYYFTMLYFKRVSSAERYAKEIEYHLAQINSIHREKRILHHLYLSKLYFKGVKGKINDHSVTEEIKPNVEKSISHQLKAIECGYIRGFINLAKILVYKRQPDYTAARRVLDIASRRAEDVEQAEGIRGEIEDVSRIIDRLENNIDEAPRTPMRRLFATIRKIIPAPPIIRLPPRIERRLPRPFEADTQNIHDHAVTTTLQRSIRRMRANTRITSNVSDKIHLLERFIASNYPNETGRNALRTLGHTCSFGGADTALGVSELEVLNLVMHRIGNDEDKMRSLVDELASGIEFGNVVCTQGRLGRIVNSLNGLDRAVDLVHTDSIKHEMFGRAPIIRERVYHSFSPSEREELDTAPDDAPIQAQFAARFKAALMRDFTKDYVETGLLTLPDLHRETSTWIDEVV